MPTPSTFVVFAGAALVLLVIPGPAVIYITTRSISQGRVAGIVSVLGITTGTLVHIAAAAVGLSALLVSSAVAFRVTKYAGAAYLIFLGVQKLRERPPADGASRGSTAPNPSYRKLYWQGVLVNVLNPKTALFFFAFLPQFVDPARGAVSLQIVVLGCFFAILGLLSDGTYAIASASAAVASRLRGRGSALRFLAGGTYVALGLAAAIGGRTPQSTKA